MELGHSRSSQRFETLKSLLSLLGGWCSQAPQSSTKVSESCMSYQIDLILISLYGFGSKRITVNYRKAAMTPLVIGSNKSLRGVGNKGVIKGKGYNHHHSTSKSSIRIVRTNKLSTPLNSLVINGPSKNIIIQVRAL